MKNDWFKIFFENDGVIRIEFSPSKDRFWPPSVLQTAPIPLQDIADRQIQRAVINGPGSVWMYAYAAANLAGAGVTDIEVASLVISESNDDFSEKECQWCAGATGSDAALLKIDLQRHLSGAAIERLIRNVDSVLRANRPTELLISGRASALIYARVAQQAVLAGVNRIVCLSARDGIVEIYRQSDENVRGPIEVPQWAVSGLSKPEKPLVIGVLGDPNHGKSLFSETLDWYRSEIGIDGWLLDCDGQSPTSPWYLSMTQAKRGQEANDLRQRNKVPWTDEMERLIVRQLQRARETFPVLIADLPGGNFRVDPPQRIPNGRERILREIDGIILMDSQSSNSEQAWRNELQRHGLESRIFAVIESRAPLGSPSLSVEEDGILLRGVATGLDRKSCATTARVDAYRYGMERLWRHVFERS
jgi:hypothetical protein